MKKLMVVLAAVALAMGVQASTVNWKLTAADNKGWNVYAFANTTVAALQAICESTTAADWASLGTAAGATDGARGALSGSSAGFTAGTGSENMVFVLVNGEVADGNQWVISTSTSVTDGYIYDKPATPASGTLKVTLASAATGKFSTGTGPTPIPEPTSGLLMLLGVAGLALRRRRA